MKSRIIVTLFLVMWACVGQADWITMSTPEAIPDNNALGIEQTMVLSGFSQAIESVEVRLVITGLNGGVFNGDLFVSLQHESGYAVLLNRVGVTSMDPFGYGDNGFDVIFTLAGPDIHTYQAGSYSLGSSGELTGSWGVDGRVTDPAFVTDADARTATLLSFEGLDANGAWTLFVADMSQHGEGSLESWGLNIAVVPEPLVVSQLLLGVVALALCRRSRRIA